MDLILSLLAILLVAPIVYWARAGFYKEDVWSIGIYRSSDPLKVAPHSLTEVQPVLSASHVSDAVALFVADPFLVHDQNRWLMFFEVLNSKTDRGEIAYASSPDGLEWKYEQLILREPFHLSYPQVFRNGDDYYMVPETAEAASVRLYKASVFPTQWHLVGELLQGRFLDSTICRRDDGWYLFTLRDDCCLALYCADRLEGPWIEHPHSPLSRDLTIIRPGGRIFQDERGLFRFAQDGTQTYGRRLLAIRITTLTRDAYEETVYSADPWLGASGTGWNADGMHHVDLHKHLDRKWIAAVDGKLIRTRFSARRGARALINRAGLSRWSRPAA